MNCSALLFAAIALSTLNVATAQTGTDGCTTPTAIAGQGLFPFDQTGATMGSEGQNESLCYVLNSSTVDQDVWFAWTADATGTVFIQTCGQTAVDTKIASYPGGTCPTNGSALACNDDSCGLQSLINFPCTNGVVYTLQIGTFLGATPGTGMVDINIAGVGANDNCSTPELISGQGGFVYGNAAATTGLEGQNEPLCYAFGATGIDNDVWFLWTANATGPATISNCFQGQDTKIAAYPALGCPVDGTALVCNDNSCGMRARIVFDVTANTSYLLQVGNSPGIPGGIARLDISIEGPPEAGFGYCFCGDGHSTCGNVGGIGNGCGNGTTTEGANLHAVGNPVVGADDVVLLASGLVPNQAGLYFQGDNAVNGGAGLVFGDGLRCAGGGIIRLGVQIADSAGESSTSGSATPISVKGAVSAGDTKYYQLWYRDPAASPCAALFNLTNGFMIQW